MANQILVVGVSGAGKTCLIRRLEDPNTTDWSTIPTVGAQPTKVQNFIFQEVGGQLQPLWTTYAQEAKGIIFVMDLAATNQISEAATAALELRASVSLPMIIYFRSATCFRNAKMFRSAFCLNEFPLVVEANDKTDVWNIFKFCHQTNKL